MATLVLGTVGRALGGPIGGLVGTFLGGTVDRAILGGGKAREGARLGNLAVQSSAYGEPLPRVYGSVRVAGNLIWTAGIAEAATTSGGGKRGGARTTNYSYSASFAVVLSAREVVRVARVWADGKLLRDAGGAWLTPVTMRLHDGSDGQAPDPLMVAAEAAAPAYRGLAYAVFEDLPLADYGNRIPNLTFEVVADDGVVDAATVALNLAPWLGTAGGFAPVDGFVAARTGSAREPLAQLAQLFGLTLADDGARLVMRAGGAGDVALPSADLGAHAGENPHAARRSVRAAAGTIADSLAIGFLDPARDYQPGLQRATRHAGGARASQIDAPIVLAAAAAKQLATDMLARDVAARDTATLCLPWRALGVGAGARVSLPDDTRGWRVRRASFADFVVTLDVERQPLRAAVSMGADAGRVHDAGDAAPGPTTLHILDLPPLFDGGGVTPRLWIAAAGAAAGWRRCGIALSNDDGDSYAVAGEVGAPSPMGDITTPLPEGCSDRWNQASVDVMLLSDTMWLESRNEAAVLAGGNLALIGDEIVQFSDALALGSGRFRLSSLLRARRGTTMAAHPVGARFVMLDPLRLLALDPPAELIGRTLRWRPTGSGDAGAPAIVAVLGATALRPLSPVFLTMRRDGADTLFDWRRRSRSGFAWLDGVDAPLGEAREAYRVTLEVGGTALRDVVVDAPTWRYDAAALTADGIAPGTAATLTIAQTADLTGPGTAATATFNLV